MKNILDVDNDEIYKRAKSQCENLSIYCRLHKNQNCGSEKGEKELILLGRFVFFVQVTYEQIFLWTLVRTW